MTMENIEMNGTAAYTAQPAAVRTRTAQSTGTRTAQHSANGSHTRSGSTAHRTSDAAHRTAQSAQRAVNSGMQLAAAKARSTGYSGLTLAGIALAAVGTLFGVIGLLGGILAEDSSIPFTGFWGIGMMLGLASYLLAGGMGHALKCAWGIAKVGWFIIPVFPADVITGLCGLVMGFMVFTSVPLIFVMKAVHEKYGR